MMNRMPADEPSYEAACAWWPDLPDIWTPVGRPDHMFRFNVLWNGTIIADPYLNRRTKKWEGMGAQLAFMPLTTGPFGMAPIHHRPPAFLTRDDGLVRQGWQGCVAPVLWSEFPADGLLLRQEVFAHVPGVGEVETGIEPLFAWVRLTVHDVCRSLPLEDKTGFVIIINARHFWSSMSIRGNRFDRGQAAYPRRLSTDRKTYSRRHGLRIVERGGLTRLAILPEQDCRVVFEPRKRSETDSFLFIEMPARKDASVDLLLPMLPAAADVLRREMSLGRDGALREATRYWRRKPRTAALIDTPEKGVNDAIRHGVKRSLVISERDPATGNRTFLTGSLTYANLWTTSNAMKCIMLLDALGYHDAVAGHLEMFRREQGAVVPPGDAFRPHPGYFSTPASLKSVDWLSDHGAILYTIAEHALLTGDERFVAEWLDPVLKACDFIRDARAVTGHGGVPGIMPPAVATDRRTQIQGVWNDGWNYKGLTTAIRLLRRIKHPRAAELAREARNWKSAFVRALRAGTRTMPSWTDANGRKHRLIPTALHGGSPDETRHAFYLDTGPLFCVFAGLLSARDPLMRSTLLWFREGPQVAMHRFDSNCFQVPCLQHEMSSCEPCYSWNVFHAHQLGDRTRFLQGMYSLFAGSISRQTSVSCETRGGVSGLAGTAALAT